MELKEAAYEKKKLLGLVLIVMLIIILTCLGYNYYYSHNMGPQINDQILEDEVALLKSVVWPDGTELLEVRTYVGGAQAVPSFENVQLWIRGLVKTDFSAQELTEFLQDADAVEDNFTEYTVMSLTSFLRIYSQEYFDTTKNLTNYDNYYVIYSFSLSMEQNDYRMKSSVG